MSSTVEKTAITLDQIFKQLCDGKHMDRYDALSLAKVDTDESFGDSNIPGLRRMCQAITDTLNTGLINQQATLILLREKYDRLQHGMVTAVSAVRDKERDDIAKEVVADISWDTLPAAPSENRPTIDNSSVIVQTKREMHPPLQKLHNEVYEILTIKLHAMELIDEILAKYTALLTELAEECSIANARARVRMVVQPYLIDLTAHRFLDTAEERDLLKRVKEAVAEGYMRGSIDLAECRLSQYRSKSSRSGLDWSSFKRGMVVILLLWAVSECMNNERLGRDIWEDPTFSIFICLGDLTLLLLMWGVSMRVWRTSGIDYITLLSLGGTDVAQAAVHSPEAAEDIVIQSTTDLTLAYLVCFILFNKALRGSFSLHGEPAAAHALPSLLLVVYIVRFFSPLKSRATYLRMLGDVLTAPAHPVIFRDGYIGDLLTSLVRVSISLSFSLIYLAMTAYWWISNHINAAESVHTPSWKYSTLYRFILIPFLTIFPLWIRFMQCLRRSVETGQRWPHYFNALKYCSAMVVFSFAVFRPTIQHNPVWILGLLFATCYQFFWDITMDWGLVRYSVSKGIYIRKERSICSTGWYVAVVCCNFLLRFSWAITLLPQDLQRYSVLYNYIFRNFQTVMAAAEIVRRMVWGFFRLEWEHIEKFGSAPVSPERRGELELEAAKSRCSEGSASRLAPTSMQKMEIGASAESSGDHIVAGDWEWIEVLGLSAEHIFSVDILRKYAVYNYSREKWTARVLEALALTAVVVSAIAIAAFS